uniref:cysteine dioxygenase n=1 Tax=Musa acuminata subsp. malaccensis TaxID=214687 RepID=A0A804I5A0_MUSAM|nr:PREDICTED: plant cysteine oxidase 1-like isoform X6 [Musa acuminata subsp. malaccensis]
MRVQGELADQRTPELSAVARELTSEKRRPSSKKNKRKQKKVGSTPSAVQRLFETCKEVFADGGAGIVPSPEDVDRLRSVLDYIDASDVGLTQNMPYFRHGASTRTLPITYLHIYKCDKLSIGIFCLPPSAVIPLHNHPGMTVFSKLLFGSMHIKSYDWVNVPQNSNEIVKSLHFQPPGLHLAKCWMSWGRLIQTPTMEGTAHTTMNFIIKVFLEMGTWHLKRMECMLGLKRRRNLMTSL